MRKRALEALKSSQGRAAGKPKREKGEAPARRYCLRYAAGIYWLLDLSQPGVPYRKPVPMNETGAMIWTMISQGKPVSRIVSLFCEEYGVAEEEACQDVELFLETMKEQGIDFGEFL